MMATTSGPSDLKKTDSHSADIDANVDVDVRDIKEGDLSEYTIIAEGEERTTVFVWILVFCCGISGLLFGAS